jgi:hypothetical protein
LASQPSKALELSDSFHALKLAEEIQQILDKKVTGNSTMDCIYYMATLLQGLDKIIQSHDGKLHDTVASQILKKGMLDTQAKNLKTLHELVELGSEEIEKERKEISHSMDRNGHSAGREDAENRESQEDNGKISGVEDQEYDVVSNA